MLKMAVLVSGGGTNLQAIIDSIVNGTITNAEISVVISNNANAYALERAKKHGIEARCISPKQYETREAFNEALLADPVLRCRSGSPGRMSGCDSGDHGEGISE